MPDTVTWTKLSNSTKLWLTTLNYEGLAGYWRLHTCDIFSKDWKLVLERLTHAP